MIINYPDKANNEIMSFLIEKGFIFKDENKEIKKIELTIEINNIINVKVEYETAGIFNNKGI